MFANYQNEIYARGVAGVIPSLPVALEELEERAKKSISSEAYGYIAGGAGSEATVRGNLAAFHRWKIVPRMMRDVSKRSLKVNVLGVPLSSPVLLAPIGVQSIAHAEGELAVARAAQKTGVPYIYSTAATHSIEATASEVGETPHWFQLYWPRDREITKSFLRRAEDSGYSALVVTLDTRLLAWRERDLSSAFLPFLKGEGMGIYLTDPVFRSKLAKTPEEDLPAAIALWAENFSDVSQTWDDLEFLRENTRLPIILKGILHPDDARQAVDCGVDGIVVSNHGGRQMDGAISALDALPGVFDAVGHTLPVFFDSGIRRGSDIFKALALGASAVFLGRPYMWGLAAGGEEGVCEVIKRLHADLDLTMALAGCSHIEEINSDWLVEIGT
jgi:lactate 2-monooxygenase